MTAPKSITREQQAKSDLADACFALITLAEEWGFTDPESAAESIHSARRLADRFQLEDVKEQLARMDKEAKNSTANPS